MGELDKGIGGVQLRHERRTEDRKFDAVVIFADDLEIQRESVELTAKSIMREVSSKVIIDSNPDQAVSHLFQEMARNMSVIIPEKNEGVDDFEATVESVQGMANQLGKNILLVLDNDMKYSADGDDITGAQMIRLIIEKTSFPVENILLHSSSVEDKDVQYVTQELGITNTEKNGKVLRQEIINFKERVMAAQEAKTNQISFSFMKPVKAPVRQLEKPENVLPFQTGTPHHQFPKAPIHAAE